MLLWFQMGRYGLGNDFIVLDARKDPKLSTAAEPKRATALTDRKIGIVRNFLATVHDFLSRVFWLKLL